MAKTRTPRKSSGKRKKTPAAEAKRKVTAKKPNARGVSRSVTKTRALGFGFGMALASQRMRGPSSSPKPKKKRQTGRAEKRQKKSKRHVRAAKLGWERRKRRALELGTAKAIALGNENLSYIEIFEGGKELREKLQRFAYIRMDGRPAKHPSILRHFQEAPLIREALLWINQSPDEEGFVNIAGDIDSPEFQEAVYEIADTFSVSVREVYTLFMSP